MVATRTFSKGGACKLTFEDLKGLRAESYIRDSTLDQGEGFGPDIQRHNIERFADTYDLVLGKAWYTEFVSGRQAKKRPQFQQFLEDAYLDLYDVLLVDHTSRFGRNQEECIRYKGELHRLGKVVVFVSQGIISGSDRDFLTERINETIDEQYSRNLSRYVSEGMERKAERGYANGLPPLGYKSEKTVNGGPERKVQDADSMPALITLLRTYSSGDYSYQGTADLLNSRGYRNRHKEPFTLGSVKSVLTNRFYEGKVVHHRNSSDEQVVDGIHEVPDEVRVLWTRCQEMRNRRAINSAGHPRVEGRSYPLSRVLQCNRCGSAYHGEPVYSRGVTSLRMIHDRRDAGRYCSASPKSQALRTLKVQFGEKVVAHMALCPRWKARVLNALGSESGRSVDQTQIDRIQRALENLRKQHLWGDLSDESYLEERRLLKRQLEALRPTTGEIEVPNLERGAELLDQLVSLWSHPGVADHQRERLVKELFKRLTIDGKDLVSFEPMPRYAPLFAMLVDTRANGNRELDSPPSPP